MPTVEVKISLFLYTFINPLIPYFLFTFDHMRSKQTYVHVCAENSSHIYATLDIEIHAQKPNRFVLSHESQTVFLAGHFFECARR
jgi:hypothetical protein